MATQTMTEPTQTFTTEGETSSARKGGGPPRDEPKWLSGSGYPFRMPGGGGGRGRGGDKGGGGGGGPPAAGLGRNPDNRNGRKELSGKEPVIFDGDRTKAKVFMVEWAIYTLLSEDQEIMRQAFSRAMLYLTYIKGPNVQEWVGIQVAWLGH